MQMGKSGIRTGNLFVAEHPLYPLGHALALMTGQMLGSVHTTAYPLNHFAYPVPQFGNRWSMAGVTNLFETESYFEAWMPDELSPAHNNLVGQFGLESLHWEKIMARPGQSDCQMINGTQNGEATPKHRANPYRLGAWLLTPDTEATLNHRAALIISPVDPVDRCTARQPWRSAVLQPPV
ncbi:unnamed protein product [Pleuronectes platessa]|uniref:Uncharacterized protein n=1 Tax=Pleuronectes platessa TaxID=8262 RepID=A0A9N7Z582_PLEPL|nr:unnamed protein product [Pleuronectes platessa]